jgi:hypothetical protein
MLQKSYKQQGPSALCYVSWEISRAAGTSPTLKKSPNTTAGQAQHKFRGGNSGLSLWRAADLVDQCDETVQGKQPSSVPRFRAFDQVCVPNFEAFRIEKGRLSPHLAAAIRPGKAIFATAGRIGTCQLPSIVGYCLFRVDESMLLLPHVRIQRRCHRPSGLAARRATCARFCCEQLPWP